MYVVAWYLVFYLRVDYIFSWMQVDGDPKRGRLRKEILVRRTSYVVPLQPVKTGSVRIYSLRRFDRFVVDYFFFSSSYLILTQNNLALNPSPNRHRYQLSSEVSIRALQGLSSDSEENDHPSQPANLHEKFR